MISQICFSYEPPSRPKEYLEALRKGAKAKVTVRVVDEQGQSVSNAIVRVYFRRSIGPDAGKTIKGLTNIHGDFSAEEKTTDTLFISVEKENYYTSRTRHVANPDDPTKLVDGKWQPWNPMISVVLREIRNPVPMYVSFAGTEGTPGSNRLFPIDTNIGFDCEKGDYVHPYGKGDRSDIFVQISSFLLPEKLEKERTNLLSQYVTETNSMKKAKIGMTLGQIDRKYYKVTLFVPDMDGGFIKRKKRKNSDFVSEYEAPISGYDNSIHICVEDISSASETSSTDITKDDYLVFRTRIVRNDMGEIISEHFGKIYGPISHRIIRISGQAFLKFECYFNPKSNSRSIEFDGKNNLFFPHYKTSNHDP